MRPVNLIPPEERRGEQAPLRTGPLAYILLGALVAVLVGVTALVLTGNQISDTQERSREARSAKTPPRRRGPQRLASYTQFRELSEQRVATVQQPRRQPLRLGTGDARTLAGPARATSGWSASTATASPGVSVERRRAALRRRACAPRSPGRRWN